MGESWSRPSPLRSRSRRLRRRSTQSTTRVLDISAAGSDDPRTTVGDLAALMIKALEPSLTGTVELIGPTSALRLGVPAGAQLTAIGSDDRTHGVDAAFLMDDDIPCFTCRTESSIWARCRATATTASAAGLEESGPPSSRRPAGNAGLLRRTASEPSGAADTPLPTRRDVACGSQRFGRSVSFRRAETPEPP